MNFFSSDFQPTAKNIAVNLLGYGIAVAVATAIATAGQIVVDTILE